jgi:hypothetical protein
LAATDVAITRSVAASYPYFSGGAPSVKLGAQGDLIIVTANAFAALTGISDSGGYLTWIEIAVGSWSSYFSTTWVAVITAAAAATTVTVTPASTSLSNIIIDSLVSGVGVNTQWYISGAIATNPASSTTAFFPDITTPSGTLLAYWGSIWCGNGPTGGVTPINGAAFTYTISTPDAVAFSAAVAASTAYQPTASMSPASTNAANGFTVCAGLASQAKVLVTRQAIKRASFR